MGVRETLPDALGDGDGVGGGGCDGDADIVPDCDCEGLCVPESDAAPLGVDDDVSVAETV